MAELISLAGVVALYGILFTVLTTLQSFILKRTDKELNDLIGNFNRVVINQNLTRVIELKKQKNLKNEDMLDLRKNLNSPVEIRASREELQSDTQWSFISLLLLTASTLISLFYPAAKIGELDFMQMSLILSILFFFYLFSYYSSLKKLRKIVVECETKIQDSEVI